MAMILLRKVVLTALLIWFYGHAQTSYAQNQTEHKYFDGPYLGVSMGSQNIFGGAFINDLDLLAQKNGFVLEFLPGIRKQIFNDRMMIGFELQFGITDGDLITMDPRYQWEVSYENSTQKGDRKSVV